MADGMMGPFLLTDDQLRDLADAGVVGLPEVDRASLTENQKVTWSTSALVGSEGNAMRKRS